MGSMGNGVPALLQRRNSISTTVPLTKLDLPSKPPDQISRAISDVPSNYTSIKDLLPCSSPTAIQSPRAVNSPACRDISIRNRLVKQAAWAYLQPMDSRPASDQPHFFRRLWGWFRHYVVPTVAGALDHIRRAICIGCRDT